MMVIASTEMASADITMRMAQTRRPTTFDDGAESFYDLGPTMTRAQHTG